MCLIVRVYCNIRFYKTLLNCRISPVKVLCNFFIKCMLMMCEKSVFFYFYGWYVLSNIFLVFPLKRIIATAEHCKYYITHFWVKNLVHKMFTITVKCDNVTEFPNNMSCWCLHFRFICCYTLIFLLFKYFCISFNFKYRIFYITDLKIF